MTLRRRGRPSPADAPAPADLLAARERYDLDTHEAAGLIYYSWRAWQEWEAGRTKMHPCAWELFNIKAQALSRRQGKGAAFRPATAAD